MKSSHKIFAVTGAMLVALIGVVAATSDPGVAPEVKASTKVSTPATKAPVSKATVPAPATKPSATPVLTKSQEQAVKSAKDYLEFSDFSRKGLIHQLEFEGFSKADAIFGVDYQKANWNEEAAESAKSYLETSSFSRKGLIHQLEFEGFTKAQAVYGVDKAGL